MENIENVTYMFEQVNLMATLAKDIQDMLQSGCTLKTAHDDTQLALSEEGEQTMAKHRLRVCIDYNDNGSPVIKQISGNTELELADRIVKAVLNSPRKFEFLTECGIAQTIQATTKKAPTFKEYAEHWLKTYKAEKVKPKTLKGYSDIIKCHFVPAWGDKPIDEIRVEDVQSFLNDRKEHSKKSLTEMRTLLKQILNSAVSDKLTDSNPAADKRVYIPIEAKGKVERRALTVEELRDVIMQLDKLQGFDRLYLAIVAYTGMRRGEVLGLKWEDIDFDKNEIHVRRNVTHTSNKPIIGTPKTEKGKRDIPIIEGLLKHLTPAKSSGFIISHDKTPEEPLTMSAFKNMWKRIKKDIDIISESNVTSHGFRHTLATMLYQDGVDVKTIQAIIGHADVSTTMNIYVHADDSKKQECMKKLGDMLTA